MTQAHSTDLYFVGTGILSFDRFDADGLPTGLRDLGNATEFTLGVTIEKIEHTSFREGVPTIDLERTKSRKLAGKFTLDEYDRDNLKMYLFGETAPFAVRPMTSGDIVGELDLVGMNDIGEKFHVQLWSVKLSPTGELNFIGADWGLIPFEFTVQADETSHPDCPYGLITPIGWS